LIRFEGKGILLDVEGTTSAIAFVYEVLFPYARAALSAFLERTWDSTATARAVTLMAADAGEADVVGWLGHDRAAGIAKVRSETLRRMDRDEKSTGLKELQGLIWREGYAAGKLVSHVFPDVPPALETWNAAGRDLRIFSSGSVAAQRVFFAHTEFGDLTKRFRGHYDTTVGPKREAASYAAIAREMSLPPGEVLFLSDVVEELDAARRAGMGTGLVVRPGNKPIAAGHGHQVIESFDAVILT
jgi:enolase-phosphatase E1